MNKCNNNKNNELNKKNKKDNITKKLVCKNGTNKTKQRKAANPHTEKLDHSNIQIALWAIISCLLVFFPTTN